MLLSAITSAARASPRLRGVVAHLPAVAATVAIGVGALALFGWLTRTSAVTHALPGPPFLLANGAVMMVLAGMSLALSRRVVVARSAPSVARACAIGVCVLAVATLSQYVLGIHLGIDRLLGDGQMGTYPVGRPTPHVALAFALLGTALLVSRHTTRRGRVPADFLALGAAVIAGGALLGHLFGAPAMFGAPALFAYVGMSVPTALVLVTLAAGILALNAERGIVSLVLAADPGGVAARRMLFGLVVFTPVAIGIVIGARVGWYAMPIASALVVLVALTVGCSLVLVTASHLSRNDVATRAAVDAMQASEQAQRVLGSELALAYAAERARRDWLQSVIDQLPEGVIVVDAAGNVEAVNRVARTWASGEDGDRHVTFDTRTPDGAPVPVDELPILRTLRTREPTTTEEYVLHPRDGQPLPVAARATPVRDAAGDLTGAVVVIHDIVQVKEAERMREEWTAVIAHDLRGPVATILMTVEAMLEAETKDAREEDRRAVRRIRRSASRLHRMIDDLLDAALITSNRLALQRRRVDLVDCVSIAIDSVRLTHPDAVIELDAPPRLHGWVDGDRIDQIVENLLTNAVKYGAAGAPIHVTIAPGDGATEISVANEGPAIPREELPRLFGRFSRTAGARASGTAGIGLGLFICKGLVEGHGGQITVTSEPGRTRFAFTLPGVVAASARLGAQQRREAELEAGHMAEEAVDL